jgi:hypothetical protein
MLHSMDSYEYSQWIAFERAHGPIFGEWDAEALANIQEQLQQISFLLSQAHFTDKTHRRGPVEKPERFPRPDEFMKKRFPSPVENFDEFDEEEWLPPTEDELVDVRIDPQEAGVEEE